MNSTENVLLRLTTLPVGIDGTFTWSDPPKNDGKTFVVRREGTFKLSGTQTSLVGGFPPHPQSPALLIYRRFSFVLHDRK